MARLSSSTTPSCVKLQVPSEVGNSESGRPGGTTSGCMELYSAAACTSRKSVSKRAVPDLKRLRMPVGPIPDPVENPMRREHQAQREEEHEPSFGAVKQAFGQFRIRFAEQAGERDACSVDDDRDVDGSREQRPTHPDLGIEEVGVHQ